MTIKAIETEYNGYRFRSRLEARWAVFFDALGIEYEYEKEGYELENGWYLPDFWLPELDMWVEVKGEKPSKEELDAMGYLCEGTRKEGLIVQGIPSPKEWNFIEGGYYFEDDGNGWWDGFCFTACEDCKEVLVGFTGRVGACKCEWRTREQDEFSIDSARISAACRQARSARFEHGEKP